MSDGRKLSGTGPVGRTGSRSSEVYPVVADADVAGRCARVRMGGATGGGCIEGGVGSSSGGAVGAPAVCAKAGEANERASSATKARGRADFIDIRVFLLWKARTVP